MITLRKYINYYKIFRGAVKTKNLVKEKPCFENL